MHAAVVSRDTELTEVEAFLTEVEDGFAVFCLSGEAGIGKTTIWQAALSRAGLRGITVLSSRPVGTTLAERSGPPIP